MGAYLGKGGEKAQYFYQFGEALGMAYQIRDDILGIWGVKESTGKSIEEDLRQRKKTLPVVYALGESKDKTELKRLYSQRHIERGDIPILVGILDQSGARDHAQNLVQQCCRRALEQLEASGLGRDRQAPLKQITHFLAERNY